MEWQEKSKIADKKRPQRIIPTKHDIRPPNGRASIHHIGYLLYMQMSFNMTVFQNSTHLLLLLLLLFPNICFGNDAIEHKTTSVLFYYNAEASISYQDTKGREHRVVSWLPMTLHVSFNHGSFAYKTYPGIVIKTNNGSFSNIYRRDLFVNHAYIQSLWIHNRMYFNLLKTACDFAQLISKNIGDFNIFEYKNMPAYQFLLEHK